MGNLHRIQWIDQRIRAHQYPNCNAIAAHFEISRRQAARDIEYLRDSLGAPLEYSPQLNGYCYADESFRIPQLALSIEDREALHYLSEQYLQSGNKEALRLAELFRDLSRRNESEGRDADPPDIHVRSNLDALPVPELDTQEHVLYRQISQAVEMRKKLLLDYCDAGHRISRRTVHPYLLFYRNQTPYLIAFCELRNELRTFVLTRIRNCRKTRLGFIIPADFNPKSYLSGLPSASALPHSAQIHFNGQAQLARYPHPYRLQSDGLVSLEFIHSKALIAWLLSHSSSYEILSPRWLRERFREHLQQLLRTHMDV